MILQALFQTQQTVFDLKDLAFLLQDDNYNNLKSKIAYYVQQWYLTRLRKGIFVRDRFDLKELACKLYTPSYISFETVLYDANIIFQYTKTIYVASYLSRTIDIIHKSISYRICYRKLKDDILFDDQGIIRTQYYTIASPDRAITDMRYLQPNFYFDNLPNGR